MMRLLSILARLRGQFSHAHHDSDWSAEFESHLEMHIEDNKRAGMGVEEARRQALMQLGGIDSLKESMRDQASFAWIGATLQDIRYALRGLRRSRGFTFTTLLSLALGLGASLAIFTVADNLLVRPLPYRDASRLVMVWEADPKVQGDEHNVVSPANFLDWRSQNDVLEGVAAASPVRSAVLVQNGRAEEFGARSVTSNFFPLLGVRPIRGRFFSSEEDRPGNASCPGVISYRLWQGWFGGDENIIGRKVVINSQPGTIVGVLPPNFYFLDHKTDLWGCLGLNPARDYRNDSGRWMLVAGRLRQGVTIGQAQAHMAALAKRLERAYPAFNTNWTVNIQAMRDAMFPETKAPLLVLLAAVAMLLAVACANVANLLLARYSSRTREIAVRASLGAGRWRVIRQLLTESLVLGLAGGVLGVAVARWAVAGLVRLAPPDLAQAATIQVDFRIVLVAGVLSLATSALFGIAPALVITRVDLFSGLRGGAFGLRAGRRLRTWLVGAEVSLSVILLAGSLLLLRSLVGLESVNLGFDPSNVVTFRVSLTDARYMREAALRTQFFQQALDEIRRLPGVRAASAASFLPLTGPGAGTSVNIDGRTPARPGEELSATIQTVMPGYFHTLGVALKSGRDFSESDNIPTSPYRFIVNEEFVRRFLNSEQPLGKRINVIMDNTNPYGEIIGVAGNLREWWIDREPPPTVYYVHSHLSDPRMVFMVRADNDALNVAGPARRVIQQLNPAQPIAEVQRMEDVLGENYSRQSFSAWLVSGFAVVAVVLAAIGIYGLLAYSVTARTREFGVRAALGAESSSIILLVLRTAAGPVLLGLAVGNAGAVALSGLLKNLLFGVAPHDPTTFAVVPLLFAAVAMVAAVAPARRAARLDPMDALRTE
jgi:putative ABC transport system permease protein